VPHFIRAAVPADDGAPASRRLWLSQH
jgi:hypothetical protein